MRDTGCRAPRSARLCSPAIPLPGGCTGQTLRGAAVAFSSGEPGKGRRARGKRREAPLTRPHSAARTSQRRQDAAPAGPPLAALPLPPGRRPPESPARPRAAPASPVVRHRPTSHLHRRSSEAAMLPPRLRQPGGARRRHHRAPGGPAPAAPWER